MRPPVNVEFVKNDSVAREIGGGIFPSRKTAVAGWIRNTIGDPEFGWDNDTVYAGFCMPMNEYMRVSRPALNGALCVALIEETGGGLAANRELVAAAEEISYGARAFEDLVLGYRYRDDTASFASVYGGAVSGSITCSLLGFMYNTFLHCNPLGLAEPTLIRLFDLCAKEAARARYVAGMQIAWMRQEDHVPLMREAISYAANGPLGSGVRMILNFAAAALRLSPDAQKALTAASGDLAVIGSIAEGIRDLTPASPRKLGDDFRIGKVAPITVLTAQDRKLPIRRILRLLTGFELGHIVENAVQRALDLAKQHASELGCLAKKHPDVPSLAVVKSFADMVLEESRHMAREIEGIHLS